MARVQEARETAEAVARRSYGKLIAFLAARTGDVAAAEDALSEAFAAALVGWAASGIPNNAEAWLIAVARRKTIDALRRRRSGEGAVEELRTMADELAAVGESASDIPDERLALMFVCAHPAIDPGIRAPLIVQTVLGFDAATIASAFLISPATMGQRLVRAKTPRPSRCGACGDLCRLRRRLVRSRALLDGAPLPGVAPLLSAALRPLPAGSGLIAAAFFAALRR